MQGNTKKITDDVAALKPSLFIAVPRVLERIQAGIDKKVLPRGASTQCRAQPHHAPGCGAAVSGAAAEPLSCPAPPNFHVARCEVPNLRFLQVKGCSEGQGLQVMGCR